MNKNYLLLALLTATISVQAAEPLTPAQQLARLRAAIKDVEMRQASGRQPGKLVVQSRTVTAYRPGTKDPQILSVRENDSQKKV